MSKPDPPKPVVYVSGPYSKGDPVANTREACRWWEALRIEGVVTPICPHWSMFQHFHCPIGYEDWLTYDFEIIRRCHAMLRIPGESSGADRETAFAIETCKIPVFADKGELYVWAKKWADAPF